MPANNLSVMFRRNVIAVSLRGKTTGQQRSPSKFTPGAWPLLSQPVIGSPAAMTVCQKSGTERSNHNLAMRRIRPRVSRSKAFVLGRSAGRDRLMRNYSLARQRANLTDIDKDFLKPSFICRCWQTHCRQKAQSEIEPSPILGKPGGDRSSRRDPRRDKSGECSPHLALAGASLIAERPVLPLPTHQERALRPANQP